MPGIVEQSVIFTTGNNEQGVSRVTGRVVDKINMKLKKDDTNSITGYMIVDENGKLWNNIAHWRIQEIITLK